MTPAPGNRSAPVGADADDPFEHLPHLRQRLRPAADSSVRVTPAVMAQFDAHARAQGLGDDWRLSEQQLEAGRRALLGDFQPPHDLWIFGYGSLMWDPGVHFAEVRRATLPGHERRFCHKAILGRGTPDAPALMLALRAGEGHCQGLAFRLSALLADEESALLWRREMIRNGYTPGLHRVHTPQGDVQALVFAVNPDHEGHAGGLTLQQEAEIIASACGVIGSNRDYLVQLAAQLAGLGITDPYIDDLLQAVQQHAP